MTHLHKVTVNALLAGIAAFSGAIAASEGAITKSLVIAASYAGIRAVFGALARVADSD